MKKPIILLTVAYALTGCLWNEKDDIVEKSISISKTPVNIEALNTQYDDYNSNYDPGRSEEIIFSTNRNSKGKDFDLIYKYLYFLEDKKSGNLTVEVKDYGDIPGLTKLLRNINSARNEFGPYMNSCGGNLLFMYSTGNSSGYDIRFMDISAWYGAKYDNFDTIPKSIPQINEYDDDLYPTFSVDKKNLIFCSNKNSKVFNLYDASSDSEITKEDLTNGHIRSIEKITTLSSSGDDKCPFIGANNMMVFTSNRKGGFGGYDLYYSYYENGEWTKPKNFGSRINTSQDEFRPITFSVLGRNIMIFSSNRRGGKGGFDLYAVEYGTLEK